MGRERQRGEKLVLARPFVVALAADGPCVAPTEGRWPIPVDGVRLRFLEMWARLGRTSAPEVIRSLAEARSATRANLQMFANALDEAGLLRRPDDQVPAPTRTAPPPDPPAAADPGPDELLVASQPVMLELTAEGFVLADHDGTCALLLSASDVELLTSFLEPRTTRVAQDDHQQRAGTLAVEGAAFDAQVARLVAGGALYVHRDDDIRHLMALGVPRVLARRLASAERRLMDNVDAAVSEAEADEALRQARTGTRRPRVVPVTFTDPRPPLALGLIVAHALAHDGGRLAEKYRFLPTWVTDEARLEAVATAGPAVFLFSNYLWSHDRCLQSSARVKEVNPDVVTIHGGPSTPKFPPDVAQYLATYRHVDIVVRGEGEQTVAEALDALAAGLGGGPVDLSVLSEVAGLTYRSGEGAVRTADRPRITDLDAIPSPFLTGLFDPYREVPDLQATIETNRGCPYGCTFCDWGSATLSRIRPFAIERVEAELEWCAENQIVSIGMADANFGIWSRDVTIARHVAELKGRYGFPAAFGVNYAKNTTKHLRPIVEALVDARVIAKGTLAVQSMDDATLQAVDRSNISLERYGALASEFRRHGLPLFLEIMVGLPGQTLESYADDLQYSVDAELAVDLPITQLLVNSPMNDPAYRQRHRIETSTSPVGPGMAGVVATATFDRRDYQEMIRLRRFFVLAENFGVLRHVARFVRAEEGSREIDFYRRLLADVEGDPARWPHLTLTTVAVPWLMVPPVSWAAMVDDLHDYAVRRLGLCDDSALATVLAAQHAVLPSRDRAFPDIVELPHDLPAWHRDMLAAKEGPDAGRWPEVVAPLRARPPATMVVDDPGGVVCAGGLGVPLDTHMFGLQWELRSPLARVDVSTVAGTVDYLLG